MKEQQRDGQKENNFALQSLHLQNFKCFENQVLRLRPLTLLSGLNSTDNLLALHRTRGVFTSFLTEKKVAPYRLYRVSSTYSAQYVKVTFQRRLPLLCCLKRRFFVISCAKNSSAKFGITLICSGRGQQKEEGLQ